MPQTKVWVNGTFDVLHIGHISLLEFASHHGVVRVGLDTDKRVKNLKGNSRPFNNLEDRIKVISSLKYVNDVVSFDSDDDLINQIKTYSPDIIVIGDDYIDKNIIGSEYASNVIFFKRIENKSTSAILDRYNSK